MGGVLNIHRSTDLIPRAARPFFYSQPQSVEPLRSVQLGRGLAHRLGLPENTLGKTRPRPGFTSRRSTVVIPDRLEGGITILTFVLLSPHPFDEPSVRAGRGSGIPPTSPDAMPRRVALLASRFPAGTSARQQQ